MSYFSRVSEYMNSQAITLNKNNLIIISCDKTISPLCRDQRTVANLRMYKEKCIFARTCLPASARICVRSCVRSRERVSRINKSRGRQIKQLQDVTTLGRNTPLSRGFLETENETNKSQRWW